MFLGVFVLVEKLDPVEIDPESVACSFLLID